MAPRAPGEVRTRDPLIMVEYQGIAPCPILDVSNSMLFTLLPQSQVLYQLSYGRITGVQGFEP